MNLLKERGRQGSRMLGSKGTDICLILELLARKPSCHLAFTLGSEVLPPLLCRRRLRRPEDEELSLQPLILSFSTFLSRPLRPSRSLRRGESAFHALRSSWSLIADTTFAKASKFIPESATSGKPEPSDPTAPSSRISLSRTASVCLATLFVWTLPASEALQRRMRWASAAERSVSRFTIFEPCTTLYR